jgi:long-chain acyl-CoA synthetase
MTFENDIALDRTIDQLIAPGGQFEIIHATIRGADYPVFKAAPENLRDYLAFFFATQGDKEFLIYRDERWTFAQVFAQARRIAAALQYRHGIAKGDRVAIAMRNYPEWVSCFVAGCLLGAVVVPMNAWWTGDELAYGIADSGTRLVIADEERARRLDGNPVQVLTVRTSTGVAEQLGRTRLEDEMAAAPATPWYFPPIAPEDDATIMYTSGSTGNPKGAVATQRSVVSGALNYLVAGLAMLQLSQAAGVTLPEQQVTLLNVPLFHITGTVPVMLVSIAIGRKMVIMHKWDPGDALRLIEKERVTYFVGVPTMSLEMMQHPDRDKYDLSTLMDIAGGGAPRPPEHVGRLAQAFPKARPALGYGLTETNGVGAGNLRDSYLRKPNSTGRASKPLVEIAIFDDNMKLCPTGARGEVCIRSVANVRGYWNNPTATTAAFMPDGWFLTGDIGTLDDEGYLFIVDRKKDIIIRGGENISCVEVEAAIYAHPAVAEASVFALPDERMGELVGAVVYPKPGDTLEIESLLEFLKRNLAAFKVPAKIWLSKEQLPRLGSAKIDKVTLRNHYRAIYAAEGNR